MLSSHLLQTCLEVFETLGSSSSTGLLRTGVGSGDALLCTGSLCVPLQGPVPDMGGRRALGKVVKCVGFF